jgi:ketosteroid isomerase-like protein
MDFAQAFEGLRRSYEMGIGRGEADWVAALYAEDGVILGPGAAPIVGREAIRAYEQEMLGAFHVELSIETAEVQDLGEKACGYGGFKMKLTPKQEGAAAVEVTGKYLNVVQPRGEEGKEEGLEILRHCWNTDQPMPRA